MFIPLTLFIISLTAIIFLIVHKIMELHRGTTLVSQEMRDKGDVIVVEHVAENGRIFLAKSWLAFRATFLMIKRGVYRGVVHTLHGVQQIVAQTLERVKRAGSKSSGKKEGSVSFFLKQVSDEAKQVVTEEQK